MKIVADYKKRKELKEYLPHAEHWKLKSESRKSVEPKTAVQPVATSVLTTLSPNSAAAELAEDAAVKLTSQPTEERERKRGLLDAEESSPPSKKSNMENGENEEIDEGEERTPAVENGTGAA